MPNELSSDGLAWTGERYLPHIPGSIELEHVHRYLVAKSLVRGKRVLDIASGEGYGSAILAAEASQVIGVDISPDAVRHAKATYSHPVLEYRTGSAADIPVADASIDIVVSFETIEHHFLHEEMMCEIRRVLAPDGFLVISSPDRLEYSDRPGYSNPYHVRELYRNEFSELLQRHFKYHYIFGQKIVYGSAIVAEENGTDFRIANSKTNTLSSRGGIEHAVYLIAVAGNHDLPLLSSSLLEAPLQESDLVRELLEQQTLLHTTIGERDKHIDELNKLLIEVNQAIEMSRLESNARLELNRSLHEDLINCKENEASVRLELTTVASANSDLQHKLEMSDSIQSALQDALKSMQASRSWRLTAPLRSLRRILGGTDR